MQIPRGVRELFIGLAFPVLVTVAFMFNMATFGEIILSSQLGALSFFIQRYFWTERDYHQAKQFFMFRKR